jgi:hypothetical protein
LKALQLIKGGTLPVFLLCVLIGLNWSCKENSILPKNLIPGVDNLNTFDTSFQVVTHTLYQDSFPTGGRKGDVRLSINSNLYSACGSIQADPVFGSTFASMHVEVLPAIPNFTFKAPTADMIIDSVVLSLPYKMAYGDTGFSSIKQKFRVFRSVKAFPRDSAQYEFTRDSIDENNLLSTLDVNFNTLPIDSPLVAGVRQQPQLRFKLASWFVDSVKAQVDLGATGALGALHRF